MWRNFYLFFCFWCVHTLRVAVSKTKDDTLSQEPNQEQYYCDHLTLLWGDNQHRYPELWRSNIKTHHWNFKFLAHGNTNPNKQTGLNKTGVRTPLVNLHLNWIIHNINQTKNKLHFSFSRKQDMMPNQKCMTIIFHKSQHNWLARVPVRIIINSNTIREDIREKVHSQHKQKQTHPLWVSYLKILIFHSSRQCCLIFLFSHLKTITGTGALISDWWIITVCAEPSYKKLPQA